MLLTVPAPLRLYVPPPRLVPRVRFVKLSVVLPVWVAVAPFVISKVPDNCGAAPWKRLPLASESVISKRRLTWGLVLLGFASLYREGFEVVLFLQTYYLQMGGKIVLFGSLLGLFFTGIVALLTFVAHKKLPYRKMLVSTGVMLGVVCS